MNIFMLDTLNGKRWPVLIALGSIVVLGGVYWGLNRTALNFGPAENSYLQPNAVKVGDAVQACFNDIMWYRVWPATGTQWFECQKRYPGNILKMTRLDMQERTIKIPASPGRLPPKCRTIGNKDDIPYPVPSWCEAGPLHYGGYVRVHTLWGLWDLTYDLPPKMDAEIRK